MSAQLNTISGIIYEDFIVKMIGTEISDLTASIIIKCTVVITGIISVALVVVIEQFDGILQASCFVIMFFFLLGLKFFFSKKN